jgi:hypothetical protein
MGSSAILMAGLCSVLFISSQALTPDATATDENSRSSLVASQLAADLRLALGFSERTARAVTFTTPDRDGDGQVETLRYSWSGTAGDPLMYRYNSNAAVALASNVQQFNLTALTRVIPADTLLPTPTRVEYKSFGEKSATSGGSTSVDVPKPSGVVAGDFLMAAVTVNGAAASAINPPDASWTLVSRSNSPSNDVGLGVWWKIATGSEPANYTLSWTGAGSHKGYGWVMRFTGAHATSPINAFVLNQGTNSSPQCLPATTSVNNTLVVRTGGFGNGALSSGIANHTTITMDRSGSGGSDASGGAAYVKLPAAGTTGAANFALTSNQAFVTVTIAIAPAG